jgi:hypothetical protein
MYAAYRRNVCTLSRVNASRAFSFTVAFAAYFIKEASACACVRACARGAHSPLLTSTMLGHYNTTSAPLIRLCIIVPRLASPFAWIAQLRSRIDERNSVGMIANAQPTHCNYVQPAKLSTVNNWPQLAYLPFPPFYSLPFISSRFLLQFRENLIKGQPTDIEFKCHARSYTVLRKYTDSIT